MLSIIKLLAVCGAGGAIVASLGLAPRETHVNATCMRGSEHVRVTVRGNGWRRTVKDANLAASQAPGSSMRRPGPIHLTFAYGGWVRFLPDISAVASDSLPPLIGMHFPRDSQLTASNCEAAEERSV
jgi:hypothetical protein